MSISSIRGAILEELVLYLLAMVGYRIVQPKEEGTDKNGAGLIVRGRGEWHQIDALAAFDHTPAFMYPLRLLVEAKCYAKNRPIGIETTRNAVGVLKDITENYFTITHRSKNDPIQVPRFNYHAAIFSTSGYTENAQRYALAHQIFLIQYEEIFWFIPVTEGLLGLKSSHFRRTPKAISVGKKTHMIRQRIRALLGMQTTPQEIDADVLTNAGLQHISENIINPLFAIKGSYFGMLQGKWPIHLLSNEPLPAKAFEGRDEIMCKIHGQFSRSWSFVPSEYPEGDERYFRLGFDLPLEILEMIEAARRDEIQIANIKQTHFSFLDLAGKIGGVRRQVRLQLDPQWIDSYTQEKIRKRNRVHVTSEGTL